MSGLYPRVSPPQTPPGSQFSPPPPFPFSETLLDPLSLFYQAPPCQCFFQIAPYEPPHKRFPPPEGLYSPPLLVWTYALSGAPPPSINRGPSFFPLYPNVEMQDSTVPTRPSPPAMHCSFNPPFYFILRYLRPLIWDTAPPPKESLSIRRPWSKANSRILGLLANPRPIAGFFPVFFGPLSKHVPFPVPSFGFQTGRGPQKKPPPPFPLALKRFAFFSPQ